MREKIAATYGLTPIEFTVLTAYGTLTVEEVAARIGRTVEDVNGRLTNLSEKVGLSLPKLQQLGSWLHTGMCPVINDTCPEMWRCPDVPVGCGETQPFMCFEMWPVDTRCVRCIAKAIERSKKRAVRLKAVRVLEKTVDAIRGTKIDLPQCESVISGMLMLEGGVQAFVAHWHEQLTIARTTKAGAKYVLD